MKMPIRYNIVKQLINNPDGLTPDGVYELIKDVYPSERTCTPKHIDKQLMNLKGTGLTEVADVEEAENGDLIMTYRITDYGKNLAHKDLSKFLD